MTITEIIQLAVSSITLLGLSWVMISRVKDPDAKASEDIAVLKERLQTAGEQLLLLKENHISHIERDIVDLREGQIKLFTILDERLPKR